MTYHPNTYHPNTYCPSCAKSHWHIGRISAECGFCGTALLLSDTSCLPVRIARFGKGGGVVRRAA